MSTPQSSLSHLDWPEALSHPNRVGPQRLATAFNVGALSHPLCHRHQPCPHRTPALVCAHTRTRVGAGAMKKALCTTSTSLGAGTATTTPAHVHLAQSPARLCPQVQLAQCRLSPTPSRTFRGVPTPISCPGLSACLDLLAEGAHHKLTGTGQGQAPNPGERSPSLGKPDGS